MRKRVISMAASMAILTASIPMGQAAAVVHTDDTIPPVPLQTWYTRPAPNTADGWEQQATQLGNGLIGAMIFGGVAKEKIQVNEKSIWSGGPGADPDFNYGIQTESANAKAALNELRTILQKQATEFTDTKKAHFGDQGQLVTGNYSYGENAARIAELEKEHFGDRSTYGSYQTLGDIYLSDPAGNDSYSGYKRSLDLRRGVATISYQQSGITYSREYFVSYPGNVMVMKLTASQAGAINRDITLDSVQPQKSIVSDVVDNTITMSGRPSDHDENGEIFTQQIKVMAKGGSVVTIGGKSSVRGADEVLVYMTAGTNYLMRYQESDPVFSGEDPLVAVEERIAAAVKTGYDGLLKAHLADYQALFGAMDLNLGVTAMPNKPTDQLLAGYDGRTDTPNTPAEDRYLENLYYQFGRYLLIASSRQGSLPANLQGIWAKDLNNPWSADYHTNINIQMNYWLAEQTNLSACHLPMIDFIHSQAFMGEKLAQYYYARPDGGDVRGWAVNVGCNAWNHIASNDSEIGFVPTAGTWMCQDIWEYYQFNQDKAFLEENFDTLLGAALFWVDNLWTDERDGKLVVNPSYSPEHGILSLGTTFDQGVVWEIFNEVIQASEVLGKSSKEIEEIKAAQTKLSGPQIGLGGQFMEWKDETSQDVSGDGGHRHVNHLFMLHPGNQIVAGRSEQEDKYIEAMIKTLETRGDGGTGWSKAWKINFWARLRDGDHAHTMVSQLLKESTAENLFDLHPPFQIDGNFGGTAGMTEMLLQSQGDAIELLPALPQIWGMGEVNGLKARGNVEVDMVWNHNTLTKSVLRPGTAGDLTLRGTDLSTAKLTDAAGKSVAYTVVDEDTITFSAKAGETYTLEGMTDIEGTEQALQSLRRLIEKAQAALDSKKPTDAMYNAKANLDMREAIDRADEALQNTASNKFDYLDGIDELQAAFDLFNAAYDLTITLSSASGIYASPKKIGIQNANSMISIRYTLDGSDPTLDSPRCGREIMLPYGLSRLRVAAFYQDKRVGDTAAADYLITPAANAALGAAAKDESGKTISGYPVANMVDGKSDTRWATTQNGHLVSTIEFKNTVTFDVLVLDEFASDDQLNRTQSYLLECWDGSQWVEGIASASLDAADQMIVNNDPEHPGSHAYKGAVFPAVTTSKVRLTTTGNQISIWEFGLYNSTQAGDTTLLRTYVEECAALNLNDYDQTEAFEAALAAAQTLLKDTLPTSRAIAAAYNALVSGRAAMAVKVKPVVLPGDVNENGTVTAEDALMALQAATQKLILTDTQIKAADVDGRKGVTAADALMILQAATHKIQLDGDTTPTTSDTSHIAPTQSTQPPREVSKEELRAEMNRSVDTGKYTELSVKTYLSVLETCKTVCDMNVSEVTKDHYRMALEALVEAKANLTEKPQTNWIGSFSGLNSTFGPLSGGSILYADWTYADQYPIDLSSYGDRSQLRLQFTVRFQSDDAAVDPAKIWSTLVFKLRSGDTNGKENNIGWEYHPADVNDPGKFTVSVPLNRPGQHVSNAIDWSDINRMLLFCYLNEPYKATAGQHSMRLSNLCIVDVTPIQEVQQQIRTELDKPVDTSHASTAALEAYENARQVAQNHADASVDIVSLYDVNKALNDLKMTIAQLS